MKFSVKFLSLIAAIVLAVTLSSCGTTEREASDSTAKPAGSENKPAVPKTATSETAPSPEDLEGLSAEEALALANSWGSGQDKYVVSSTSPKEIVFTFAREKP